MTEQSTSQNSWPLAVLGLICICVSSSTDRPQPQNSCNIRDLKGPLPPLSGVLEPHYVRTSEFWLQLSSVIGIASQIQCAQVEMLFGRQKSRSHDISRELPQGLWSSIRILKIPLRWHGVGLLGIVGTGKPGFIFAPGLFLLWPSSKGTQQRWPLLLRIWPCLVRPKLKNSSERKSSKTY